MKVSRYNYANQYPSGTSQLAAQVERMLRDGRFILTQEVADFEAAFAQFHEVSHARGVNSGTDALAVVFQALGISGGDEVVTQANTFNATVAAILMVGAKPVLVDADASSYLMDAAQLPAAVTSLTRAIVPVHLYGKPTPIEPLQDLSRRHGIPLVEDAAQAHGARWRDKRVGSFGVAGCFSFHPSKNLAAAGDAGAVITTDGTLAEAIDEIRSLGQRGQNNHIRPGLNTKLDSIQAMVLSAKLASLDEWNAGRRKVAALYRERLRGLPLGFQAESQEEEHVYHLFQVRSLERDSLLKHLVSRDVDAVIRYPQPIHLQPAFSRCGWQSGQFPVAEALARELLCLPIRPDLTVDEIDYVTDVTREFYVGRN